MEKSLYALSILFQKKIEEPAQSIITHNMILGYRLASSENEARGSFYYRTYEGISGSCCGGCLVSSYPG